MTHIIDIGELAKELREHDDERLYLEADVLMSRAADALARLDAALTPRLWTQEMSDAWHLNSDLNKAFEALRAAACGRAR